MDLFTSSAFLLHETGTHPECKERILSLGNLPEKDIEPDESILTLVHTPAYIQKVKELTGHGGGTLDPDTVVSEGSFKAAVVAANAAVMAASFGDFAVVRPPGHHAHPDHSGGFCIFNSIAVAAQKLVTEGKKVLIIDIDGHLGDGTEQFFLKSDRVLYVSLHQEDAYPGGGTIETTGEGKGKGYTVNVPLPRACGDDIFLSALHSLLPLMQRFAPDYVGISAGFDGHMGDPLLQLRLSVNSYYDAGRMLSGAFPRLFAVLEGGYNLTDLPHCLFSFLAGVNGKPIPHAEERTDSPFLTLETFDATLHRLQGLLAPVWGDPV